MKAISLQEFYEKFEKKSFGEKVCVKNPYVDAGLFEIIKTIGKGSNAYVFLALETPQKTKLVVLRLSYEKDDFEKKLRSVKELMGDEYKTYLLELIDSSMPVKYLVWGEEKLFFDSDVFLSTWEPADAALSDKLGESFENKLKWFNQFLKGLSVIHKKKRLHLDIKLANLLLVGEQLKISDLEFYLKTKNFLKDGPIVCGSPGHIAPEMFYDRDNVSTKSDIFSAGVTFCQLFTGVIPGLDYIQQSFDSSKEEQEELKKSFGNQYLTIRGRKGDKRFIENFRVFNFFKKELNKKLASGKIADEERTVYKLLLEMMEINPDKRPDINVLLFKIHELVFDPELLVGQELVGYRYKVRELIDAGGRGSVFKVWDQTEEIIKAIKLFPPQFNFIKEGFDEIKKELMLARDVTHRNVVNVYGLEKDGDLNFIVMEYINGFTLKKKLDSVRGKKLKEPEALAIMRQVAAGLMEAHRNKVIHRNLKDKNIMIKAEDNSVKIINFGLSLKIKQSISETGGQKLHYDPLSIEFSTPEQLAEILDTENAQTDVWRFGAILYQSLMGKTPFAENDFVRDPATISPITGVSDKTRTVVMKCLEKDREKRYRNMQEVYDALFGDEEPIRNDPAQFTGSKKPGMISKIARFFTKFRKKLVLIVFLGLLTPAVPGPGYYPILSTSAPGAVIWQKETNIKDIASGEKNWARAEIFASGVTTAEN